MKPLLTLIASLALCAGALSLALAPPHQLTLQSQIEGPFAIVDHSGFHRESFDVDQFDPATGSLRLVRCMIAYDIERQVFAENESVAHESVVVFDDDFALAGVQNRPWFWECWIEYERVAGRVVRLCTVTEVVDAHVMQLERYDGQFDFSGTSGDTIVESKSNNTGWIGGSNGANSALGAFVGTGTITLTHDSWDQIYSHANPSTDVTTGQTLHLTNIKVWVQYLYL